MPTVKSTRSRPRGKETDWPPAQVICLYKCNEATGDWGPPGYWQIYKVYPNHSFWTLATVDMEYGDEARRLAHELARQLGVPLKMCHPDQVD